MNRASPFSYQPFRPLSSNSIVFKPEALVPMDHFTLVIRSLDYVTSMHNGDTDSNVSQIHDTLCFIHVCWINLDIPIPRPFMFDFNYFSICFLSHLSLVEFSRSVYIGSVHHDPFSHWLFFNNGLLYDGHLIG